MRVKYIKMISYLSLIFLTANFILCISNLKCINGYTFLWMLIIMAVVCSEVHISNILRVACCVLTFVPIFFEHGLSYKVSVAIVGAVLLGTIETLVSAYINSSLRDFFSFAILIIFLIVKPTGLFGVDVQDKA